MEKKELKKNRFGLLGRNIPYSFSRTYFTQKFKDLGLEDHSYENFDLQDIAELPAVLAQGNIRGLNVTIPYKEAVIPFLDALDPKAEKIGAVNTIKVDEHGLKGYNTDAHGFQISLEGLLAPHHNKALVLGTGGASKAVFHVLGELGIAPTYVSRRKSPGQYTYGELDREIIGNHTLIVNCTPLGTFPHIEERPDIPYQYLGKQHLLFDLIYNPDKTRFLALGEAQGASIGNGLDMLQGQAEQAWEIWNAPR